MTPRAPQNFSSIFNSSGIVTVCMFLLLISVFLSFFLWGHPLPFGLVLRQTTFTREEDCLRIKNNSTPLAALCLSHCRTDPIYNVGSCGIDPNNLCPIACVKGTLFSGVYEYLVSFSVDGQERELKGHIGTMQRSRTSPMMGTHRSII